jgi:hypothetical protein
MKRRIDLRVEENIWKEYQKLCIDKNKVPSYKIEKFMEKELKKNGK